MEGISLGSAFLRLYGDRSALDRELAVLKRYTDQLEKQGIKVKFDADTGQASREVDQLKNKLNSLNDILRTVGQGLQGDSGAWAGLQQALSGVAGGAGGAGGAMGKLGGALGGALGMASKALPVLGQLGLAAQGLQAIFFGVSAAVNSVLGPLQQLSQQAGRFNQQVAEAGIFTSQSFGILGPDGKAIEGTANQMRAVRGVITREYKEIQKEVAKISGATASEIYEGFNLILQNSTALGKEGESLGNIRKLSTRLAAATNVLGVPGDQYRSEVSSLLTGDVQVYDQLANKLYGSGAREKIQQLKEEGKYYEDLMQKLEKLYQGQEVLSASLSNVQSNFEDVFQTINTEGGQALERGLAGGLKAVLDSLDSLQGSFAGAMRGITEAIEPLLRMLGEIGGWLVSLGSMLASLVQIVGDVGAVGLNLVGLGLLPLFKTFGGILQVIAKVFELLAAAISTALRPLSTFFRVLTGQTVDSIDSFFDGILKFFDDLIAKAEGAAATVARPFVEMAKGVAWLQGKLRGMTPEEIAQRQAVIESEFATSLGGAKEPELRALNLSDSTKKLLQDREARLGTGSTRRLNEARELSQLVQDRVKNEIQGLEQALKLMGAQKGVQQAMNDLAESRRGLETNRANFAIQVAASPEARLAAEGNRNELAYRQEQERINERRALLGTEREMLQMQLQIQLKQQKLQQEQLRIQRLELQIQKERAQGAIADITNRMQVLKANSPEFKSMARQRSEAQAELRLRSQQLEIIDRTVELGNEMVGVIQQTNALEGRTLDIKGQQLGIQEQLAGATREQQALLTELQRQEQAITTERDRNIQALQEIIGNREREVRQLQEQQKVTERLHKLAESRLELQKAQAAATVQAADAELKVAQAKQQADENPTSVKAVIGAQIEALAAGTRGLVSEADATRRLYDAKERQLALEQTVQREQLRMQQLRESSELRIQEINLQRLVLEQKVIQERLHAEQQLNGLRQERDALSAALMPVGGMPAPGSAMDGNGIAAASNLPPSASSGGFQLSSKARALVAAAGRLGVNPLDLATIIGFETGGSYSPSQWGGAGGNYMGLIQFGPTERRMYGAHQGQSFEEQVQGPVVRYFQDRFRGAGMSTQGANLLTLYRTVLGGNPKASLSGTDAFGTSPSSGVAAMGPHRQEALRRFFGASMANVTGAVASSAEPATSLQNSIDQNSDALKRSEEVEKELITNLKELRNTVRPDLLQQQGLQVQTQNAVQQAQQDALRIERNRAQLTAGVLNSPRGRLAGQLTEATAGTLGNSLRGVISQLFGGQGFDLAGMAEGISRTMAERMTGALVDAAMAPIEQALTQNLFRMFSGVDVEEQARKLAQEQATSQQQAAATSLNTAGTTLQQAGTALGQVASALAGGTNPPSAASPAAAATGALAPSAAGLAQSMDNAGQVIDVVATTASQTAGGFSSLMQNLGRVGAVLGGVAMAAGGVQQMRGGGTYNTLMGLAGIFGSIGSITGMFAGRGGGGSGGSALAGFTAPDLGLGAQFGITGGFGGFRAYGGTTTSNLAYLTGERGRELFVPHTSGTVIPNDKTEALLQARGALGGGSSGGGSSAAAFQASREAVAAVTTAARQQQAAQALSVAMAAPARPLDVRFESRVINGVEYVTAEQFQQGLRDAAERGRAMTLKDMRNSVKVRRSVGMG